MGGTGIAKLMWRETETATIIIIRTGLGTFPGLTLLADSS
jgi:hypothetical protein